MVGIIDLLFWDGKGKGFCHKMKKMKEKIFTGPSHSAKGCFGDHLP